MKFLIEAQ